VEFRQTITKHNPGKDAPVRGITTLVVASAVLLAGCGGSTEATKTDSSAAAETTSSNPEVDKYKQTWTTPYGETTCAQFLNEMTRPQTFAMAADILFNARESDKPDLDLPSDEMVNEFRVEMTNVCTEGPPPDVRMGDVAVGVYMTDASFQP
jgi:hypothetical protein